MDDEGLADAGAANPFFRLLDFTPDRCHHPRLLLVPYFTSLTADRNVSNVPGK
jgi:hypothetical protein